MNRRGFLGLLATAPVVVPVVTQVVPAPVAARGAAKVANFGVMYGVGSPFEFISISLVREPLDPHARIKHWRAISEGVLTSEARGHTMGCKMKSL